MKKKTKAKNYIFFSFIKHNAFIFIAGIVALLNCCVCVFFKSSTTWNVPVALQPWGDFAYNVSISVIAAVVFYVVQVYIPNRKKDSVLNDVVRKYCKEVLLKECTILKTRIDILRDGSVTEEIILPAIHANCQRVNKSLNKAIENYFAIMPDNLISAISDVISDDMLYQVTIRASGALVNRSLNEIVKDDRSYNHLFSNINRIRAEVEKM